MIRLWFLVALLASVSYGQRPKAWWENPIASGIGLSDWQIERVNRIRDEHRDRLTAEMQEVERAEREFESAVNAETFDMVRGRAAADQLVKARGVFTQEMSLMTLRLRRVLTAEQWRTLQFQRGGRAGGKDRPDEGRGRRVPPPPQSGSGPR